MATGNKTKQPKVLVVGFFGAGNVGDEAILLTHWFILRRYFTIVATCINKSELLEKLGIECISLKPSNFFKIIKELISVKLVFVSGGFLANKLQPYGALPYIIVLLLAKLIGKKIIFSGISVGPLQKNVLFPLLITVLRFGDVIMLRDVFSLYHLNYVHDLNQRVIIGADVALLLDLFKRELRSGEKIVFSKQNSLRERGPKVLFVLPLRYKNRKIWKTIVWERKYKNYVESIASIADYVIEKLNGVPLFLAFYKDDVYLCIDVVKTMRYKNNAIIIPYKLDMGFVMDVLKNVDVVIAGRYHAMIFSLISETPMIPVVYHPKCYDLVYRLRQKMYVENGDGIEWYNRDIDVKKAIETLHHMLEEKTIITRLYKQYKVSLLSKLLHYLELILRIV